MSRLPRVVLVVAAIGGIGSAFASWGLGFLLSMVVMLFAAGVIADRS